MKKFIQNSIVLTSVRGNPYVGLEVPNQLTDDYLVFLREHLGDEDFEKARNAQVQRDGGKFHLTLINTREMPDDFDGLVDVQFEVNLLGLGSATSDGNTAYFVVADCPTGAALRQVLSLGVRDFHVTLGFLGRDVHDVRKDKTSIIDRQT